MYSHTPRKPGSAVAPTIAGTSTAGNSRGIVVLCALLLTLRVEGVRRRMLRADSSSAGDDGGAGDGDSHGAIRRQSWRW